MAKRATPTEQALKFALTYLAAVGRNLGSLEQGDCQDLIEWVFSGGAKPISQCQADRDILACAKLASVVLECVIAGVNRVCNGRNNRLKAGIQERLDEIVADANRR
jgi:hypothetical protein